MSKAQFYTLTCTNIQTQWKKNNYSTLICAHTQEHKYHLSFTVQHVSKILKLQNSLSSGKQKIVTRDFHFTLSVFFGFSHSMCTFRNILALKKDSREATCTIYSDLHKSKNHTSHLNEHKANHLIFVHFQARVRVHFKYNPKETTHWS